MREVDYVVTEPQPPAGIRLERDGRIARITLDRPDRHNALEASDVARIKAFLEEVDARRDVRVLVLTGAGDTTFCSGASLSQMQSGEMTGAIFETMTDRLAGLRVPTVCALNGNVYGGGAELALCCDFRLGVEGMRLLVPAANLGVCYPVGGLARYVERLGLSTANRILLAAEEFDARELLRVGFLSQCIARSNFHEAVSGLAERLADLAPLAVQGMKRILLDTARGSLDRAEAERLIERCEQSSDLQEGLRAWRERRGPEFTGE